MKTRVEKSFLSILLLGVLVQFHACAGTWLPSSLVMREAFNGFASTCVNHYRLCVSHVPSFFSGQRGQLAVALLLGATVIGSIGHLRWRLHRAHGQIQKLGQQIVILKATPIGVALARIEALESELRRRQEMHKQILTKESTRSDLGKVLFETFMPADQ